MTRIAREREALPEEVTFKLRNKNSSTQSRRGDFQLKRAYVWAGHEVGVLKI